MLAMLLTIPPDHSAQRISVEAMSRYRWTSTDLFNLLTVSGCFLNVQVVKE